MYVKALIEELCYGTLLDFDGKWYPDAFWSQMVRLQRCLEIVFRVIIFSS